MSNPHEHQSLMPNTHEIGTDIEGAHYIVNEINKELDSLLISIRQLATVVMALEKSQVKIQDRSYDGTARAVIEKELRVALDNYHERFTALHYELKEARRRLQTTSSQRSKLN